MDGKTLIIGASKVVMSAVMGRQRFARSSNKVNATGTTGKSYKQLVVVDEASEVCCIPPVCAIKWSSKDL
jgi:hypothetical protein